MKQQTSCARWRSLAAFLVVLTVSTQVAAETPATALPPSEALWYEPSMLDPKLPEQAPAKPPSLHTVGVSYQIHGFLAGRPEGAGQSLEISFGNKHVAGTLGTYIPSARISLGVDVGRNWGFPISESKKCSLAYMLPSIEARAYLRLDFPTTPILQLGSSTGVRLMYGAFGYDLRPRVDVWADPNARGSVALSVGGSLTALMVF